MKKTIFLWVFLMCIIGTQAQQSLPTSGTHYLIKNQQVNDRYIGGNGTGDNAVKYETAVTNADYHVFLLTGDNSTGYTLKQVRSGLYITHNNSWTGSYATATGTNRQLFKFDNSQNNDYIVIQKKNDAGNFVNGIGADGDGSGAILYFNKTPDSERNRWVLEVATSDQILAAKKGAFNDLLATATTLFNNPSSWGYADGAWAAFTNAINAANAFSSNIDTVTEVEIDNATTNLQAAIDAVQAAVLIPRFNADETKKYRILITDTEGNYVRYMAKDPSSNKAVPKTKDLASDPNLQLWYLHPVAGFIDGYKIQNVSTSNYLAVNGEQITATESAAAVWV
ncbi:MAG: FIVAR domain-containing protein, partial [Dysgonamonadaceae bacterium]|nr:FIVAR domain-containing protein [Dysgonamonadaceae bacterium]